ncbi:hypothetical protein [Roseospira visakhapatnamensis]|uniref:Lipoprotein n=1 Tax=Roseospira visakhapatnamensis TaxID=390880 RepID=A0A7W6REM5_9PROT|nr:hypothetical protein [Roseospira visakhapatnamensis]MBB4266518.1 hypothetical protein [Roseospira visakhapatnamensis]
MSSIVKAPLLVVLLGMPMTGMLAGCGAPHLETVQDAKRDLVGQDAAVLSRCIGEPMAVRPVEGAARATHVYSSAQARGADGLLLATPGPDAVDHRSACVFDITVQDQQIVAVRSDNRAGWGFGSIKTCSAVVKRCLKD